MRPTRMPRTGVRRWPSGLVGMLALVVAIEAAVARHALELRTPPTSSWTLSARAARREAPRASVLCFGDSLVKHGILPAVVSERTGLPSYNLAVCAAQAPADYYLLRQALEAGAGPSAVIVNFSPDLMAGGPRYLLRNWPELLGPRECFELALAAHAPSLFTELGLALALPSVRSRFEAREAIVGAFRGDRRSPLPDNLRHGRNWRANAGAEFVPPNPTYQGQVTESDHKLLMSNSWWCHRVNRAYIEGFLELAERRRIAVYWLLPPMNPALQARRDRSGADARLVGFIRSLQARHPGLVVLDGRHAGFGPEVFLDPVHLDGRGGIALSVAVADQIGKKAGRWVALPPFREVATAARLEDIEASGLAIKRGEALRR